MARAPRGDIVAEGLSGREVGVAIKAEAVGVPYGGFSSRDYPGTEGDFLLLSEESRLEIDQLRPSSRRPEGFI